LPEVLVTAEDVERGKPDPQPYLVAADALGLEPSQCLVVEDAPAGIAAGRGAGARVLAVATTFAAPELTAADYLTPSLAAVRLRSWTDTTVPIELQVGVETIRRGPARRAGV
jgi:sugar-phosphatase